MREMNGKVLFDRGATNHIKNPKARLLYMWLYVHACWQETTVYFKGQEIVLKIGDISTSYEEMKKNTGFSISEIRNALRALNDKQKTQQKHTISTKTTKHYHIITICNYSELTKFDTLQQQTNDKQTTKEAQHKPHLINELTNQRINERTKKEEEDNCSASNEASPSLSIGYDKNQPIKIGVENKEDSYIPRRKTSPVEIQNVINRLETDFDNYPQNQVGFIEGKKLCAKLVLLRQVTIDEISAAIKGYKLYKKKKKNQGTNLMSLKSFANVDTIKEYAEIFKSENKAQALVMDLKDFK